MSVRFEEVVFRNNNSIAVNLTIEAPIGTKVSGPQPVGANSSLTVPLRLDNRASVLIIAIDDTHGEFRQSFAMAAPSSGLPSYLESIDVSYVIGSFSGSVKARTD